MLTNVFYNVIIVVFILKYTTYTIVTAGFSEELFFRGLVFNSIDSSTNAIVALIASSIIFGFAHFPIWGASHAVVEAILGGILGYAYWYSEYNIAVPIAIHTIYDFITLFVTWYFARNDVNKLFEPITSTKVIRNKVLKK